MTMSQPQSQTSKVSWGLEDTYLSLINRVHVNRETSHTQAKTVTQSQPRKQSQQVGSGVDDTYLSIINKIHVNRGPTRILANNSTH
jgi:hypothetical protein